MPLTFRAAMATTNQRKKIQKSFLRVCVCWQRITIQQSKEERRKKLFFEKKKRETERNRNAYRLTVKQEKIIHFIYIDINSNGNTHV